MRSTIKRIIIILALMVLATLSGASGQWKLIDDRDDITLYSREVSGHSQSQFKGVCLVGQPIEAVGSVLSDVGSYPRWFFKCIEAKKIPAENSSELHFLLYVAIDTPWPFLDRDVVYETDVAVDHAAGKVFIRSVALKRPFVQLRRQYVRITDSEHQWILERVSADLTRITFINRTNAEGPFADYLSNSGMRDTTIHSLENLKKLLDPPDATAEIQP
jgi:hypothetical protein